MQRRNIINQRQPQLLKYVDTSQANELAPMTNVLGYVPCCRVRRRFPENVLVLKSQGVLALYRLNIYIFERELI